MKDVVEEEEEEEKNEATTSQYCKWSREQRKK